MAAKQRAIDEETAYLGTVSNVQWFIYPFFKMIEMLVERSFGCCKSERLRRNREEPEKAKEETQDEKPESDDDTKKEN